MSTEDGRPAVVGQVEPSVRPLVERLRLHADNKTKQAMQRDCQMAADELERLRAAALGVVVHMEGRMPVRGWLKDNDKSRAALAELVRVLGAQRCR